MHAHCANLSLGGMFVNGAHAFKDGDSVRLWLAIPDRGEVFLSGTVKWTADAAMGVQHRLLGARDTFVLTDFLASLTA